MTIKTKTSLKSYFETGDKPTQAEFANLIDTFYRDSLLAIATAAETDKTGIIEIQASALVTALPVGAVGRQLISVAATASARMALGITSAAGTILDASTTAAARQALNIETDSFSVFIEEPQNKTYVLDLKAAYPYTISWVAVKTSAGSVICNHQIEGVSITNMSAVTAGSTEQTASAGGANSVALGNTYQVVLTGNSTAADLSMTIAYQRTG
ncbi:MAG: hypothetical protein C4523_02555 [Myxococcales bacterium]|nr:MAG: hypothetical protein C4523_02555 [Myxococcales bacterium]